MDIDLKETLKLVKGGLLDHRATWESYLALDPPWQKTAGLLTGPIIIANVLLSLVFTKISGGFYGYAYGSNFFSALIMGLVMSAIGVTLASFVFAFLAGNFQGKNSFPRALAAVSLASIPAAAGGIVGALIPGLGFLLTLAGGILSLVFLYKILPLALDVPQDKRVVHFVVSLILLVIVNAVIASVLGLGGAGRMSRPDEPSTSEVNTGGVFGELQRQSELIESAGADTFEPPADGKLSERQLRAYVKVKQKTRALQEQYAGEMQKLGEDLEKKENPSIADFTKAYSGLGSAIGANNAEMEIVKTGGGNWAEHQWVASSLRTAMIQQGDGSEAFRHNFALYEKYRDELED